MSRVRWGVPSHDPPGPNTVSRIYQGLVPVEAAVPPRMGVLVPGQTNQGFTTRGVEQVFEEPRPSRFFTITIPPVTLEATIAGPGAVSADLSVIQGLKLGVLTQGATNQGMVADQPVPAELPQVLLESRKITPYAGHLQTFDATIAGTGAVAANLEITRGLEVTIAGTSAVAADLSVAAAGKTNVLVQGHTNQGGVVRAVPELDLEPREDVSHIVSALFGDPTVTFAAAIAGSGAVAADLTVTSPAAPARLAPLIPGHTNQGAVIRGIDRGLEPEPFLESRNFEFLSVPPTYIGVAIPGRGNGQIVSGIPLPPETFQPSQVVKFKVVGGQLVTFDVSIAGQGAVTAALSVDKPLNVTINGDGAVSPNLVVDKVDLQTAIAGTSAVTASLVTQLGIFTSISGDSSVTADFVRNQLVLAVGISGNGQVVPDLFVPSAVIPVKYDVNWPQTFFHGRGR